MTKEDYELYCKMPDWELFAFAIELEHSQKKQAAVHILEMRRTQRAAAAAERSAQAARWAAVAAIVSTLAVVIGLFRH